MSESRNPLRPPPDTFSSSFAQVHAHALRGLGATAGAGALKQVLHDVMVHAGGSAGMGGSGGSGVGGMRLVVG